MNPFLPVTSSALKRAIATMAVGFGFAACSHAPETPASLERWHSYTGVTWTPAQGAEAPAAFRDSVNAPIAGIHFDGQGRAFVSTPRLIGATAPATLSLLDTQMDGGPARLSAFPSEADNAVGGAPDQHLRNVLGFHIDRRNGWVWALDMGFVAGEAQAPEGGQKVVVYELGSGQVVKRIALDGVADRSGSFLNDIAVDEQRRIAYVSDSGMRSAPENQAGILVIDFNAGTARRVLHRHPSVLPEPGVQVVSHGEPVWPNQPLILGINGIALSPDARTLYWTVTTGTGAFAIATELLADGVDEATRSAAVQTLGNVGGNTDGIVTDARGQLYITDVTRNGIVRYDPGARTMMLLAGDEGVRWPDTPDITVDGYLVFTASALNRHFAGAVQAGAERYELWRMRVEGASARSGN